MKIEDVKVGQKYRIRQWDDMMNEFSGGHRNKYGSYQTIEAKFGFVSEMRELCGNIYTVKSTSPDGSVYWEEGARFNYSSDMIEPLVKVGEHVKTRAFDVPTLNRKYIPKQWVDVRDSRSISREIWENMGVLTCKGSEQYWSDVSGSWLIHSKNLLEVIEDKEQEDKKEKKRKHFAPGQKFLTKKYADCVGGAYPHRQMNSLERHMVEFVRHDQDARFAVLTYRGGDEFRMHKSDFERYDKEEAPGVPAAEDKKQDKEDGSMGMFEKAIQDMVIGEIAKATAPLKADIDKMIADKVQRFEIKIADLPEKKVEGAHEAFKEVLLLAVNRIPTMLVGPAGCGKTTLAKSIADHLEMDFSAISCTGGMGESHLTGWLVPTEAGKFEFIESELLKRFENGGVILLDEIDAADANTLLIMNSMIANGYMFLPQRRHKPVATRHKDCIIIAAANTMGDGTSLQYAGREKLDEATLDRFRAGIVFMSYDKRIEKAVCPELAEWAVKIRKRMADTRIDRCLSTRFLIQAKTVSLAKSQKPIPCAEDLFYRTWSKEEKERIK
jgi:MoxR-like ATPase